MPTQAEAASQSLLALLFIGITECGVRCHLPVAAPFHFVGDGVSRPPLPISSLYSSLAQSVEHAAVNRRVVGSSPTGGARKKSGYLIGIRAFLVN